MLCDQSQASWSFFLKRSTTLLLKSTNMHTHTSHICTPLCLCTLYQSLFQSQCSIPTIAHYQGRTANETNPAHSWWSHAQVLNIIVKLNNIVDRVSKVMFTVLNTLLFICLCKISVHLKAVENLDDQIFTESSSLYKIKMWIILKLTNRYLE